MLGGALSVSIPLTNITKMGEFEKGHTKGWEDKFGFFLTYRPTPTEKTQTITLAAVSQAEQQWWMKAITMHKGTLHGGQGRCVGLHSSPLALNRDWNDSFQKAMQVLHEEILANVASFVEESDRSTEHDPLKGSQTLSTPELLRTLTRGESTVGNLMSESGSSILRRKARAKNKEPRPSSTSQISGPFNVTKIIVRKYHCRHQMNLISPP